MCLRRDGDDHVEGARDEVGELQLHDRALPHPRSTDRRTHEALFRDGGVEHALGAELLEQPFGDAERTAEGTDVLAQQEHAVVVAHGVREPGADSLEVGDHRGDHRGSVRRAPGLRAPAVSFPARSRRAPRGLLPRAAGR